MRIEASTVALLDDVSLPRGATAWLSPAELELLARRRTEKSRRRFLRGRLAAKWLALEALHRPAADAAGDSPQILRLTRELLERHPVERCRSLEVLPVDGERTGVPRLHRTPAPGPTRWNPSLPLPALSLSHSAAGSAAALTAGPAVGIDLETVEPGRRAFYHRSFTPAEQRWAERAVTGRGPGLLRGAVHDRAVHDRAVHDWAFTLLWTAKEAVLKTGLTTVRSAIDLTCLELRPRGDQAPIFDPSGSDQRLVPIDLLADDGRATRELRLSWCAVRRAGGGAAVLALAETYPSGQRRRGEEAA